jgi:hypothetical protein
MLQRMFVVGVLGSIPLLGSGCTFAPQSADSAFRASTDSPDRSEPTGAAKALNTKQVTVAVSGMT